MSDLLGPFGSPYTVVLWFNILSRLRDVKQLRIRSLSDSMFWIGLLLPHDSTRESLRFPSLTTLELVDVTFRRPTPGTGLDSHRFSSANLRSDLTLMDLNGQSVDFLRCLVARRKLGGSVRKLVVQQSRNFHRHDALYLGAIEVAEVIEWDGHEESVEERNHTVIRLLSRKELCKESLDANVDIRFRLAMIARVWYGSGFLEATCLCSTQLLIC
ncbi:hypothetical protein BDY19DRAFT_521933 [Irpex rosettiformis]|uniref:Uncharacterized protein n=1 Tax=Irpex rosettiformis TaxID=378272 RepID=A0ACB8TS20_9APHY|nr:hypothetical protein BDY19DRAFT_521933 [Irpex rosettiformis]